MATEEAGLKLFVEGESDFNDALEAANEAMASLADAADALADALDSASGSIGLVSSALEGFSEAAEANAESIGDAGEAVESTGDALSDLGAEASESAEGLEESAEGAGNFDTALQEFTDSADSASTALAEVGESATESGDALGEVSESATESAEVLGETSESAEDAADALDDLGESANNAGGSLDAANEIIVGGLRRIGEVAVNSLMAAGSAFVNFAADSFAGALDAEKVMARITSQIKAQGKDAAITAEQAGVLADEYKHLAGGSDDAILSAEAVLLKFNQIGGETFPDAIRIGADLAALMGTDVPTAAQQLGFALETGGDGLARIAKQTGAFTEAELENIKAMQEAGDITGAQKAILSNLDDAIGGTAETLAATTAGQWAIFQETISDTGEGIASKFLPSLLSLGQSVLPIVAGAFSSFADSVGGIITLLSTGDFSGGIFGLSEDDPYIGALFAIRENALQLLPVIQQVFTDTPAIIDAAKLVIASAFDELTARAAPVIIAAENLSASFSASMPEIQGAVETSLAFVQNLWDTVFPSIQATTDNTLTQIMTLTATILNAITAYWNENGTAILAQATFFIEATFAVISGTLALISGVVSATLSIVNGDWDAAGAALASSTSAFMDAILSIVGTDLESFKKTWSEVFTLAKTIIETQMQGAATAFLNAIQAIRDAAEPVGAYINQLLDSFKNFYSWLNTHVFSFNIEIPELPDWAIPGSPTPFEIGLRGIDKALKDVSLDVKDFAYSIEMIPAESPISPPASAGQIAAQNVHNSNLSNSLTINAQYPMQSARGVADDLRMWTMLTGNSAA